MTPVQAPKRSPREKGIPLVLAVVAAGLIFGIPGLHRAPPAAPLRLPKDRRTMGDLTLPTLAGPAWILSQHRGQVVLLNFWATWCPPCQAETPALVRIAQDYRARGLDVAGVSLDQDSMNTVPAFVADYHIPYPILLARPFTPLTDAIQSVPTTFLIDRQGRVANVTVGAIDEPSFRRELERLLREPKG